MDKFSESATLLLAVAVAAQAVLSDRVSVALCVLTGLVAFLATFRAARQAHHDAKLAAIKARKK